MPSANYLGTPQGPADFTGMAGWGSPSDNNPAAADPTQAYSANPWAGAAPKVNPLTGQTDYMSGLQDNTPGIDLGNTVGQAGSGGMGAGLKDWIDNSGFFGSTAADGTKSQGWGGAALGVAQGLGNAYMGMKQYGLAKDTLAQNKMQYAQNFAAQQKTTNANLADRQAARVASNPTAYQSVGDYMKKNGI